MESTFTEIVGEVNEMCPFTEAEPRDHPILGLIWIYIGWWQLVETGEIFQILVETNDGKRQFQCSKQ